MAREILDRTCTDTDVRLRVNAMTQELYISTPIAQNYSVLLSQSSTSAPTVVTLADTITGLTWARTAVGTYTVTKANAFVSGKTTPNATGAMCIDIAGNKITAEWTSVSVITVKTYAEADTTVLADGVLVSQEFNIKIYS